MVTKQEKELILQIDPYKAVDLWWRRFKNPSTDASFEMNKRILEKILDGASYDDQINLLNFLTDRRNGKES